MNVRFASDSIRFRVSVDELSTILKRGRAREDVALSGGCSISYEIIAREGQGKLALDAFPAPEGLRLALSVPLHELQSLLDRPPSKDLAISDGRVAVEVDFFSRKRREDRSKNGARRAGASLP